MYRERGEDVRTRNERKMDGWSWISERQERDEISKGRRRGRWMERMRSLEEKVEKACLLARLLLSMRTRRVTEADLNSSSTRNGSIVSKCVVRDTV